MVRASEGRRTGEVVLGTGVGDGVVGTASFNFKRQTIIISITVVILCTFSVGLDTGVVGLKAVAEGLKNRTGEWHTASQHRLHRTRH